MCVITHREIDRRHARPNSLGIASAKRHTKWTTTNSNASNYFDPDVRPDASACCDNCWHVYASNSCISVESVVVVAADVVVVVSVAAVAAVVVVATARTEDDVDGGAVGAVGVSGDDGCGCGCCSHSL